MSASGRRWLIYALGGGWGHLTRAASLARAAQSRHRVRVLTNSPYVTQVAKAMPELDLIALDPSLTAATARSYAVRQIEAADPGCLIVDTFPRGLGGELANLLGSIKATKVLIHRDLNPHYVEEAELHEFVRSTYDLVLIPGEDEAGAFADLHKAVVTEPWLIRDPPQNHQRAGQPRIVVCASGNSDELHWYGAVVACLRELDTRVEVRCVAPTCPPGCPPECWVQHWPAADLYSSADVVIGSAGYNTIHECMAHQVPLIAHPWPRKYDRQWLRASRAAKRGSVTIVEDPGEAAEAAMRQLTQVTSPRCAVDFQNGAISAVLWIEQAAAV